MVAWLRGLLAAIAALTLGGTAMAADAENTLYMDVPFGRVVIEMRPDLAPNHCAQIKALARRGFYDGVVFHRVIEGFMVQTGDPTGTGTGGSGHPLRAEFNSEKHVRGTTSMARTSDPNSADSRYPRAAGRRADCDLDSGRCRQRRFAQRLPRRRRRGGPAGLRRRNNG